jgi:hypothetical protein
LRDEAVDFVQITEKSAGLWLSPWPAATRVGRMIHCSHWWWIIGRDIILKGQRYFRCAQGRCATFDSEPTFNSFLTISGKDLNFVESFFADISGRSWTRYLRTESKARCHIWRVVLWLYTDTFWQILNRIWSKSSRSEMSLSEPDFRFSFEVSKVAATVLELKSHTYRLVQLVQFVWIFGGDMTSPPAWNLRGQNAIVMPDDLSLDHSAGGDKDKLREIRIIGLAYSHRNFFWE